MARCSRRLPRTRCCALGRGQRQGIAAVWETSAARAVRVGIHARQQSGVRRDTTTAAPGLASGTSPPVGNCNALRAKRDAAVSGFALSADGRTMAYYSDRMGVVVLDAVTGKRLNRIGKVRPRISALSPDGKLLLGFHGAVYDLATGKAVLNAGYDLTTGKVVLNADGEIRGCYWIDRKTVATIHTKPNDSFQTISGIGFWDVTTGREVRHLPFPVPDHDADAVAVSRDGKRSAAGGKDGVKLLDLQTGKITQTLECRSRRGQTRCLLSGRQDVGRFNREPTRVGESNPFVEPDYRYALQAAVWRGRRDRGIGFRSRWQDRGDGERAAHALCAT